MSESPQVPQSLLDALLEIPTRAMLAGLASCASRSFAEVNIIPKGRSAVGLTLAVLLGVLIASSIARD
jgi:hypothetical protein